MYLRFSQPLTSSFFRGLHGASDIDRTARLRRARSVRSPEKMHVFLSVFGRYAATFVDWLVEWNHRRRSRSELVTLSDRELLDIGISKGAAKFEARKPFWRR